jgi:thiosulfate reductase cytochrome b subunit
MVVFKRFERFWHWSQMLLIFILLFSGFTIHGVISLISFSDAVTLHTWTAIVLIVLWVFAIFWHLTTGQWRNYIPTSKNIIKVARYYAYGVVLGEDHPYRKTYQRKHNPLQALTYLLMKLIVFPAIWLSGLAYLLISFGQGNFLNNSIGVENIAVIHTAAAIAIVVFIIVHVYLLTTGHSFVEHVKPMITGYDEVELTDEELAYLQADEPQVLKDIS